MEIFHELEGDSTKNTKNTGKNGEKSQRGTLKNKSNHTSTRLTNTWIHKIHEQQKGNRIHDKVHLKSIGDEVLNPRMDLPMKGS